MPKTAQDKYDILAEVIEALRDEGQKVKIETTRANQDPFSKSVTVDTKQIPTKAGALKTIGPMSSNRAYAESMKIGKVSMSKNGNKYIIRTPNGEAEFDASVRNDAYYVWLAAGHKYDNPKGTKHALEYVLGPIENEKLKQVIAKGVKRGDKKTAFDKAKEDLLALGVDVDNEKLKHRLVAVKQSTKD